MLCFILNHTEAPRSLQPSTQSSGRPTLSLNVQDPRGDHMMVPNQSWGAPFAMLALLASPTRSQFTVPLTRDSASDSLPVTNLLDSILSRWSLQSSITLSSSSLAQPARTWSSRTNGMQERDLLGGLGKLVGGLVGSAGQLLGDVVLDPLFGGRVPKANAGSGNPQWYGTLAFGNTPQDIKVSFDTGSADIFILGPDCATCSLTNHTAFDPSASTSYCNETGSWSIVYADGSSVSGYPSSDTVWVPASSPQAEISNFLFAIATSQSSSFDASTASGLVGLGQDALSDIEGGRTIFSVMVSSGWLEQNVLGIRLVKDTDGLLPGLVQAVSGDGELVFGGIAYQWIIGGSAGLTWTKVTSSNYWGTALSDIQMGQVSVHDPSTPLRAIFDTGTTLIFTSDAQAQRIHVGIPGAYLSQASVWILPCGVSSNVLSPSYAPNLFFVVSGKRFGVPVEDLAWKAATADGRWCVSGVQGGMDSFTVLGEMFIKSHYVALRYDEGGGLSVGLGDRTDVATIL